MSAPSTLEAASMLDLARNKLRNTRATTTEKGAQHPPSKNTKLVAPFCLDEQGKLQPRIKAAQPHRRMVFCRDCRHYIAVPPVHRPHGVPLDAPGGCAVGLTTPESWPPIFPFTGTLCAGWEQG